jgi:hypothetical protein
MGGKFNPFQSKHAEVVRIHRVADRKKAQKVFQKLERKRAYIWVEVQALTDPASEQTLNQLNGETSVALFIEAISDQPASPVMTPALDALITRLWKNFNKLHLLQRVESGQGIEEERDDPE